MMTSSKVKVYASMWANNIQARSERVKSKNAILVEETSVSNTSLDQEELLNVRKNCKALTPPEPSEQKILATSIKPSKKTSTSNGKSSPSKTESNPDRTIVKNTWVAVVLGNTCREKSAPKGEDKITESKLQDKESDDDSFEGTDATILSCAITDQHGKLLANTQEENELNETKEDKVSTLSQPLELKIYATNTKPTEQKRALNGKSSPSKRESPTDKNNVKSAWAAEVLVHLCKEESASKEENKIIESKLHDEKSDENSIEGTEATNISRTTAELDQQDHQTTPEGSIVTICDEEEPEESSSAEYFMEEPSTELDEYQEQAPPSQDIPDINSSPQNQPKSIEKENSLAIKKEQQEEDANTEASAEGNQSISKISTKHQNGRQDESPASENISDTKSDQQDQPSTPKVSKESEQQDQDKALKLLPSENKETNGDWSSGHKKLEQETDSDRANWDVLLLKLKDIEKSMIEKSTSNLNQNLETEQTELESNKHTKRDQQDSPNISKENVVPTNDQEELPEENSFKQETPTQKQLSALDLTKDIAKKTNPIQSFVKEPTKQSTWASRTSTFPRRSTPRRSPRKTTATKFKKNNYEEYVDYDKCTERLHSGDPTLIFGKLRVPFEREGMAFVRVKDDCSEKDVEVALPLHRNRALDGDMVFVELFPPTSSNREKLSVVPTRDSSTSESLIPEAKVIEKIPSMQCNCDHHCDQDEDGTERTYTSSDMRSFSSSTTIEHHEKQDPLSVVPTVSSKQPTRCGKVILIVHPTGVKNTTTTMESSTSSYRKRRNRVDRDDSTSSSSCAYHHREIVGTLRMAGSGRNGGARYLLVPTNKSLPEFLIRGMTPNKNKLDDLYTAEYVYGTWTATSVWPPCINVKIV